MREYELTYIVRPDVDEETLAAIEERVAKTIAANGGQVLKTDHWGKRRLAYPIRRHNEGFYIFLRTELTDKAIAEIERQLKLSEDVIRHLLVRVEPVEAPAVPPASAPAQAPTEAEG